MIINLNLLMLGEIDNPLFSQSRYTITLGILRLWDELQAVQTHGLYGLNIDRAQDAIQLCRQIIQAQQASSRVTLIEVGDDIPIVLEEGYPQGPEILPVYRLTPTPNALMTLPDTLDHLLGPHPHLLILLLPASLLITPPSSWLTAWLSSLHHRLQRHHATLLILNHGSGNDTLHDRLLPLNRILDGLASLRWKVDCWHYALDFWCNELGVSAKQNIPLNLSPQGWQVSEENSVPPPQPHNDEHGYLAHAAALEGAPPFSEYWHLFASNQDLFSAALTAQAATLLFAIQQNDQIDYLARHIHTLRRQRGNALKIAVRTQAAGLRNSDERLLLACGANAVIPLRATLSNTLVILEGLQGHRFSRHVPASIDILFQSLQPLKQRGYLPCPLFCTLLLALLDNPLLPRNGRGTLVSLQPAPGMTAEQLLTVCHLRRDGDLATLDGQHLVLFLSYCHAYEVPMVLRCIFPLPVAELVSGQRIWHQDTELLLALTRLRDRLPAQASPGEPLPPQPISRPDAATEPRLRRVPLPLTLAVSPPESSS